MGSITLTLEDYPQLGGELYEQYVDLPMKFKEDLTTRDLLKIGMRPDIYGKMGLYMIAQRAPYEIKRMQRLISQTEEGKVLDADEKQETLDNLEIAMDKLKQLDTTIPFPEVTKKENEEMLKYNIRILNNLYIGEDIKDWMDVPNTVLQIMLLHPDIALLSELLYG